MPARKKTDPATSELSFEDALGKLEGIVEAMEGEQLPLEDLVAQYEAGSALLKHCDSVLSSARKRIELITLANREEHDGSASDFSTQHTQPGSDEDSDDDDNDIRLF